MASLTQWTCIWVNWEIVKDREAWRAAIHGVTKSRTWLSNWTTSLALQVGEFSGTCSMHAHSAKGIKLWLTRAVVTWYFRALFCSLTHSATPCCYLLVLPLKYSHWVHVPLPKISLWNALFCFLCFLEFHPALNFIHNEFLRTCTS